MKGRNSTKTSSILQRNSKSKIWFLVLLFSSNISSIVTIINRGNDISWNHQITLSDGVQLKWMNKDTIWITMEMSVLTKGYLGIGFSPHGGMAGSDIALGWVDESGNVYFKDYHGVKNGEPIEDSCQDYKLIYASEDESGTKIVFKRKWDTRDLSHDQSIGNRTMRVIWAWHPSDPNPQRHLHWHGPGSHRRGVVGINFRNPNFRIRYPDDEDSPVVGINYFDLTLYNVRIPKVETYHHCQIFKLPGLSIKNHVIGYRHLILKDHMAFIRRISIQTCTVPKRYGRTQDYFEKYLRDDSGHGQSCFADETPKDWTQFCVTSLITSSIGSEGKMFPGNQGIPIGGLHEEPIYVRLEIQYENAEGADILDSSGLRLFYTPDVRKYDIGRIIVGHRRTPFLTIPPFQQRFKIYGHCSTECTQLGIRPRGIRIFSVQFNSHELGRRHVLRHVRQGKELSPIFSTNYYDYKYEEYEDLSKEIEFLPGDELLLECEFDSSERTYFTFGGAIPRHELCEAVILYYPKSALADCRSQPELYSYFNALGVQNITGDLMGHLGIPRSFGGDMEEYAVPDDSDMIYLDHPGLTLEDVLDTRTRITKPDKFLGWSWLNYLNDLTTLKNEAYVRSIESQWRNGKQYMFCGTHAGKRIQLKNEAVKVPPFVPFQPESQNMCDGQELVPSSSNKMNGGEKFIHWLNLCTWTVFLSLLYYQ